MASRKWDNILAAGRAGEMLGDGIGGIGDGIDRAMNGGRNTQERTLRKDQLEDLAAQFKNHMLLQAALHPEAGIVNAEGNPEAQVLGNGFSIDKRARNAELDAEMNRRIKINQAMYDGRPQLSTLTDPVTGAVSVIDKRNLTAQSVQAQGGAQPFSVQQKGKETELMDEYGRKYKVMLDAQGNVIKDLGTSDLPKGVVTTDPVTGRVSVVNNMLPQGTAPGQAAGVTAPNASGQQPFSVGVKKDPAKQLSDGDVNKISAWDAMISDLDRVEKALTGKEDRVGPIAGRAYTYKRKLPGFAEDKDTEDLFSAIGSIGAEQIHERYGGSLTGTEVGRAGSWSLSANDKPEALKSKIREAIEEARGKRDAYLKNLSVKGIDVGPLGGQSQPKVFNTEAEVEAAGLPDGAKIIVNGKTATYHKSK